jgi:outer membrane protein assembly factor BamB
MKDILFALAAAFALIFSGCAREFTINRGEEVGITTWQFSRGDVESLGRIRSNYAGGLNEKWAAKASELPVGPLTIGARTLIFCGSKGRVHFYDLQTGDYAGRLKNKYPIETGFILKDGLGYYAAGQTKSRLICQNLIDRKRVWIVDLKEVSAPPIIIENRLYFSADSGLAGCIDRLTGEVIWRQWIGSRSMAGPSYKDGIVYYPCDNGVLIGLDAMTGETLLQISLDEPLMSKAAIGDKIYISGANGGFYALDKKTGRPLWAKEFPWPIWTSPAADESMVYIGDNGGYLRALDNDDGRTIWEFKAEGVIVSSPIIVGDYLLFASLDKNIYCLEKKRGLLVSKRRLKHEVRFPLVSDGRNIFLAEQDGVIRCFGD